MPWQDAHFKVYNLILSIFFKLELSSLEFVSVEQEQKISIKNK